MTLQIEGLQEGGVEELIKKVRQRSVDDDQEFREESAVDRMLVHYQELEAQVLAAKLARISNEYSLLGNITYTLLERGLKEDGSRHEELSPEDLSLCTTLLNCFSTIETYLPLEDDLTTAQRRLVLNAMDLWLYVAFSTLQNAAEGGNQTARELIDRYPESVNVGIPIQEHEKGNSPAEGMKV